MWSAGSNTEQNWGLSVHALKKKYVQFPHLKAAHSKSLTRNIGQSMTALKSLESEEFKIVLGCPI